jgi:hypothetical protein
MLYRFGGMHSRVIDDRTRMIEESDNLPKRAHAYAKTPDRKCPNPSSAQSLPPPSLRVFLSAQKKILSFGPKANTTSFREGLLNGNVLGYRNSRTP